MIGWNLPSVNHFKLNTEDKASNRFIKAIAIVAILIVLQAEAMDLKMGLICSKRLNLQQLQI